MGLSQKEGSYPMKKIFILFAAAALVLCACDTDGVGTSADQETGLDAYTAFLNGSGEAFLPYGGTCRDISQVLHIPEDSPRELTRFCSLDLDGDGTNEAVAEVLTDDWDDTYKYTYVVLHNEDGKVYAEDFHSVAFHDLKADGSYRFTIPGAYTHYGYGRKQFEKGEWSCTFAAECFTTFEPEYSPDTEALVYIIDGKDADAAAFAAYESQQKAKPGPVWYDSWEALLAAQE